MREIPWVLAWFVISHGALVLRAYAEPAELHLEQVLASVTSHHPLIEAERAAVSAAEGELLSARGEFDTVFTAQGRAAPAGYYDPRRVDVVLEQPTPVLGSSLYAGYRVTRGNVAPYYGEQRTLDAGEVRGGLERALVEQAPDGGVRALARGAARAVRHADEVGTKRLQPRDGAPEIRFHLGRLGREELERDPEIALRGDRCHVARTFLHVAAPSRQGDEGRSAV